MRVFLDQVSLSSYAIFMSLFSARQNSLSKWRSSLALSTLAGVVIGIVAGGCGAPEREVGDGGSGTTAATTSNNTTGATSNSSTSKSTGDSEIDLTVGAGDGDGDSATTTEPMGVDGEFCSDFAIEFLAQTPTVYVLVDRSGSMGTTQENFWAPLRDALLPAVEALQADVRFGFGTYTSTMMTQCDEPTSVLDDLGTITENNYAAIAAKYNGYTDPNGGDTPTSAALVDVMDILLADDAPGAKYIVLVTDGNPDLCNNGNVKCFQDSLVGTLQDVKAAGIETIIFGLAAKQQPLDAEIMSVFANAGAGQAVAWAQGAPNAEHQNLSPVEEECAGQLLGTYSATGGTAEAYLSADPAALVTNLQGKVAGLKSCTIDVNFAVDAGSESKGEIYVGDLTTPIALADWRMNTPSQIELLGTSCELWKLEETINFFAGFPCEVITEVPIIR